MESVATDKLFTKSLSVQKLARSQTLIAPRGMFLSSCRAVHQKLSSVAQSYPHVQRFLAEGSDRALGKLCHFDYWRSRL
jgi:hypothetical protein